jgi:hypothetical protein
MHKVWHHGAATLNGSHIYYNSIMNSSAKKTTDTVLFGLGLGVWLELGLLGYLHATFAYIVRRTTDYVLKTTIFESGGCRAGFTTQEVPTTTGSAYCICASRDWVGHWSMT